MELQLIVKFKGLKLLQKQEQLTKITTDGFAALPLTIQLLLGMDLT